MVALLYRSRRATVPAKEGVAVLRYGPLWRALAVFTVALPFVIVGVALKTSPRVRDLPVLIGLVVFFAAAGVFLVFECFRVGHRVSEQGIERVSPWRSRLLLPWAGITRIRVAEIAQWLTLEDKDGNTVRVSFHLDGLATFAAHLKRGARPEVVEPARKTLERFERT